MSSTLVLFIQRIQDAVQEILSWLLPVYFWLDRAVMHLGSGLFLLQEDQHFSGPRHDRTPVFDLMARMSGRDKF